MLSASVAELTVWLGISVLRGAVTATAGVRTGQWEVAAEPSLFTGLGQSLAGKTVGFVGLGRIGSPANSSFVSQPKPRHFTIFPVKNSLSETNLFLM